MNDKEISKLCGICGDKAHGYNFNAITCESCKAFFRRNALRKKEFKCPFDGNCKIDLVTRKFCKKCRLKKCLDLGMKKEWILSDDEKQSLRNKIVENRKKRSVVSKVEKVADSTTTTYNFPNVVQLIRNGYTVHSEKSSDNSQTDIEMNSIARYSNETNISSTSVDPKRPEIDRTHTYFDLSQSNSQSGPALTTNIMSIRVQNNDNYSAINDCNGCLETLYSAPKATLVPMEVMNSDTSHSSDLNFTNKCSVITGNSVESIKSNGIDEINYDMETEGDDDSDKKDDIPDKVYQKAIELEFAPIPFKVFNNDSTNVEFNDCETERIQELTIAVTDMSRVSNENLKITSELSGFLDATKLLATKCDEAIRKLVKMSKKINSFKDLCQHDQIALMKAGCFEILIMRSVVNYNYEHDYWAVHMDSNNAAMLKLDLFKQAKGNLYEAHRKFMHLFKKEYEEWDNDLTILDLLTAVILFTPDRPNIIHKEIIKLEQQTYMYLLQRYLLLKYKSKCEAKLKFLKLMSKLEELHVLHDKHVKIYLEVDPSEITPLLLEILDLNVYNTIQIL